MKSVVSNIKIMIKKDERPGTKDACYTAYVPELGIATDGDTVDETINNAKELVKFHLESLMEEGEEFPTTFSTEESIVIDSTFEILPNNKIKFA